MFISRNILFPVLIIFSLIIFSAGSKIHQDDAYIFYSYAKNIADGNGYVFNPGEKINATTSPLYTLLISGIYFLTGKNYLTIPEVGNLVGLISLLSASFLLFALFSKEKYLSFLIPFLFIVSPLFRYAFGMETFLSLAINIMVIYFFIRGKFELASLFSALAVLARFDSILLISILWGYYLIKNKKLPSLKIIFLFFIPIIAWFIFSYFYFSDVIPLSVKTKLVQRELGLWGNGLVFLKGFSRVFPGGVYSLIVILTLLIISIYYLYLNRKEMNSVLFNIIILWQFVYLVTYSFILNPLPCGWYYAPFIIGLAFIFSFAVSIFISKNSGRTESLLKIILILIFMTASLYYLRIYTNEKDDKYYTYVKAAEWLNKNSLPTNTAAIDEVGIIRYFFEGKKVIDVLGLTEPDILTHFKNKEYNWFIKKERPDFLIVDYPSSHPYFNFINSKEFDEQYKSANIIRSNNYKVLIYKRN